MLELFFFVFLFFYFFISLEYLGEAAVARPTAGMPPVKKNPLKKTPRLLLLIVQGHPVCTTRPLQATCQRQTSV